MKLFRITYKDWAYGEWFFAGTLWASSESDALKEAFTEFGDLGQNYEVEA